ncbi:MAG TPA: hypothetical protein VND95_13105 [Stellaceae bacterium]|nr:hypothetical protein [Stellaceae bacterium]
MRPFSAITAALLIACAVPASGLAVSPAAAAMATPAGPTCPCTPVRHVRPHRVVRHYVHHWRRPRRVYHPVAPVAYMPPPYNPLLPSPLDPAYDRAMTLHFRAVPVSGVLLVDRGYPPTPPVAGIAPYRMPAYGGVYQYDGLTGQYVRLAQSDAWRTGIAVPPPPMAPAAAPH